MRASPQSDPQLSELLQAWQVEPESHPDLAVRVWRRIETADGAGEGFLGRLDRLAALLTRPLVAAAALAACAVLGFAAAELQHDVRRDDALARVAAEYARSIDPVLMADATASTLQP